VGIKGRFFCIFGLVILSGCASGLQAPVYQSGLTSVAHWGRLAANSATDISGCVAGKVKPVSIGSNSPDPYCWADTAGIRGRPIYVAFGDRATAFGRHFREYLMTELLSLGHTVVDDPDGAIVVYSRAGVVGRDGKQRIGSVPGAYSLLGYAWYALDNVTLSKHVLATGVLADFWQHSNDFSGAQVVITTSLYDGQKVLFRKTDGYSIGDSDVSQYVGALVPVDETPPQRIDSSPKVATLTVLGE